jgi:release factor glutamine methyltransferase
VTTFGEALSAGRVMLAQAGVESAALDARLLLAAAAELDGAAIVARGREPLPPLVGARFDAHLMRRAAGEPVARILGTKEFWSLPLKLGAATLVPRPETEVLVEAVLAEVRRGAAPARTICDLGTGSGAIVLALLTELPQATAVATDLSREALAVAAENARALGVDDRLACEHGDFAVVPQGRFDIVVSNPPYVRSDALADLPIEVRDFDPRLALDGGPDGLAAHRSILERAPGLVAERGMLVLEAGDEQSDAVAALCSEAGFGDATIVSDLGGRRRAVLARRP